MVKILPLLLILLALPAAALAQDGDALAAELDRAADDTADTIKQDQDGIRALDRQAGYIGEATEQTKAAIDQTEDFRYRDFFSQVLNILKTIMAILVATLLGGGGFLGVKAIINRGAKAATAAANVVQAVTEPMAAPQPFLASAPEGVQTGQGGWIDGGARSGGPGQQDDSRGLTSDPPQRALEAASLPSGEWDLAGILRQQRRGGNGNGST